MTNDDENKPQKKIQIFNNKDGTYNRKDYVDSELVNEEFIDHRPKQHNYGKSPLRDFLENLNNDDLPAGWQESPLGKRAYEMGHQAGYAAGQRDAWAEANTVIDSVRNIIELHDRQICDDFDE